VTLTSDGGGYRNWGYTAAPLVKAQTVVVGTAIQFYADKDCVCYLDLASTDGDTPVINIGPKGEVTNAVISPTIAAMGAGSFTVKIPAGWELEVTSSGDATVTDCTTVTD
jgi:hypothetical protein